MNYGIINMTNWMSVVKKTQDLETTEHNPSNDSSVFMNSPSDR